MQPVIQMLDSGLEIDISSENLYRNKLGQRVRTYSNLTNEVLEGITDVQDHKEILEKKFEQDLIATMTGLRVHRHRLFSMGLNWSDQLGNGMKGLKTDRFKATEMRHQNIQVKDIQLGITHQLILSTDGKVYACGTSDNGQIGRVMTKPVQTLTLIEELKEETITQISAQCTRHSLFLTKSGKLYGCGCNDVGQLLGEDRENTSMRELLEKRPFTSPIRKIYTSGDDDWNGPDAISMILSMCRNDY